MPKRMTKQMARAYVQAYREINRITREEVRNTPPRMKLQQLAVMMGFALHLGARWRPQDQSPYLHNHWLVLQERHRA